MSKQPSEHKTLREQAPSTPNSSEWLDEIFTKLNEPLNSSRPWLDDTGAKQAILTQLSNELIKARESAWLATKAACSFNSNCNNCHANELTLEYLATPEAQLNPKEEV